MIIVCSNCDTGFRVPDGSLTDQGRMVKCSVCDHEWIAKPKDAVKEEETPAPKREEKKETQPIQTEAVKKEEPVAQPPAQIKQEEVKQEKIEEKKPLPQPQPAKPVEATKPVEAAKEEAKPEAQAVERAPIAQGERKRFVVPPRKVYEVPLAYYTAMAASILLFVGTLFGLLIYNRAAITASFPEAAPLYQLIHMQNTADLKLQMVDCTINKIDSASGDNKTVEIEVDVLIQNNSEEERHLDAIRFILYDIERNYLGDFIMDSHTIITPHEVHRVEGRLNRVPVDSYYVAIDIGNKVDMYVRNLNNIHKYG